MEINSWYGTRVETSTSAFERFYRSVYGPRWIALNTALLKPAEKTVRSCFQGYANYILDQASIVAAQALQVQEGDQVLDLCAAPGGKALILAETIGKTGSLVANELSSARRLRLKAVIEAHVPEDVRKKIQITGYDGNQFGLKRKSAFDRVLLDAPCSSEQHLLADDPEQKEWKESRTKQLAMRQYSLLCSALLALKPGGTLLYSTCSISPFENDGVVGRLLAKKNDEVRLDPQTSDLYTLEKTEFGHQIFPDQASGLGPIYFSRLIKIER